jgi:short-subunit dehydrogenase
MEHILITGGTGNLGKIVVNKLQESGYQLHLATREPTDAAAKNIYYYSAELTSPESSQLLVENILKKTENISAAVFIAGGFVAGSLQHTSMGDINSMVQLNFATAFNTVVHVINHFRKSGGGKLVFIGAKAAYNKSTAIQNMAYSLSKQMLVNFTAMVNESEAGYNTSAHILLPGALDTEYNRKQMPNADFSKWTSPEEIAITIQQIIQGQETRNVIHL